MSDLDDLDPADPALARIRDLERELASGRRHMERMEILDRIAAKLDEMEG